MVPAQINGTETEGIVALYGMTPEKIFSRDQAFPAVGMGAGPGSVVSLSGNLAMQKEGHAVLGSSEAPHGLELGLVRTGHIIVLRQKYCLRGFPFRFGGCGCVPQKCGV